MSAAAAALVAKARRALPVFMLPVPERVPLDLVCIGHGQQAAWQELRQGAEAAVQMRADDAAYLPLLRQALLSLPAAAASGAHAASGDALGRDAHDRYFHIARSAAAPGPAYLRGLLSALELFLLECPTAEAARDHASIARALAGLWLAALGVQPPAAAIEPLAPMRHSAGHAVRRWLRGHQIFAAITQGLIWTLLGLEQACAQADVPAMASGLASVARLYHASAAAFRFTADFEPSVYAQTIRPSMCEPFVPAGFSGTLSADHACLVARLSGLREPLAAARKSCPVEYAAMTQALAQVYDDHRWVCERFTGAATPSLRTDSLSGGHAAVDMLDRFKARRLDMLA